MGRQIFLNAETNSWKRRFSTDEGIDNGAGPMPLPVFGQWLQSIAGPGICGQSADAQWSADSAGMASQHAGAASL